MTKLLRIAILGTVCALVGCAGGPGANRTQWVCTTLAMEQYFQGYGTSREQAFDSSMQQCKMNAAEPSACMGDPAKCKAPSGS